MTAAPALDTRPALPVRPQPHERDGRQEQPQPGGGHPHALRAARIAAEVGPRGRGAIYVNVDGRFEVEALITNAADAAKLLRRESAQWAVIIRDTLRPNGEPFPVGSVWTTSDFLVRPATTEYTAAA
ncbi:hypothetical protein [Streptomyces sp. NPDC004286]|uniref:hypothetical protein n=1 Tax=Streptomyces sp. NPDC004286 TaxID=3364696 RepID=UPI0036CEA64F